MPYFLPYSELPHNGDFSVTEAKKYGKKSMAKSHTFACHTVAPIRDGLNKIVGTAPAAAAAAANSS